jgi:hypothetical protein
VGEAHDALVLVGVVGFEQGGPGQLGDTLGQLSDALGRLEGKGPEVFIFAFGDIGSRRVDARI